MSDDPTQTNSPDEEADPVYIVDKKTGFGGWFRRRDLAVLAARINEDPDPEWVPVRIKTLALDSGDTLQSLEFMGELLDESLTQIFRQDSKAKGGTA